MQRRRANHGRSTAVPINAAALQSSQQSSAPNTCPESCYLLPLLAPIPYRGDGFVAFNYWDVFRGDISFYLVLEFISSFSSRSYPSVRKCTDYCGLNTSTNMALKTRSLYYSFDPSVRKCNDHLVNMMNKNGITFPDRVVSATLCYCCCVKHAAHRNSKSRVYPLRCQDSGPPTRSYTAAAAAGVVADQGCCYNSCCGLGTRTQELCL